MNGNIDRGFVDESWAYFERNYDGKDLSSIPPNHFIKRALTSGTLEIQGLRVLEVGCGAGNNLRWLSERFACECVGVEPSSKVVRRLRAEFPNMGFSEATADRLPFKDAEFDLVLLRCVLHWVHRDHVLQALGEAVRCTSRWILVSDYAPSAPFRVPYAHKPGLFTYHTDYAPTLDSLGILELVYSEWRGIEHRGEEAFYRDLREDEIVSGDYDLAAVKTTIWEKAPDLVPTRSLGA